MKIKTIGIFANINKPKVFRLSKEILSWAAKHAINVILEEKLAQIIDHNDLALSSKKFVREADLVIVLGGDGTILFAARAGYLKRAPVLGINLGKLGFLASVAPSELYSCLTRIINNEFQVEKRMMLKINVVSSVRKKNNKNKIYLALNDAVVRTGALARLVRLFVKLNGNLIAEYDADGLIVATPTGSTAHSLSAGGPIVHPNLHAFILTPICPHTLSNRPIIVYDDAVIEISFRTRTENVFLTVDGQEGLLLDSSDVIKIRKARQTIKLVYFEEKNYFSILKSKLKLR